MTNDDLRKIRDELRSMNEQIRSVNKNYQEAERLWTQNIQDGNGVREGYYRAQMHVLLDHVLDLRCRSLQLTSTIPI